MYRLKRVNYDEIFGMAKSRNGLLHELVPSSQVMEHLVKLYCYPNSESASHWIDEIYAFLHSVSLTKRGKRYSSYKFIMDNTYRALEDSVDRKVKKIIDGHPTFNWTHENSEEFHRMAEKYFHQLAIKLSEDGIVTKSEVNCMLKEAGFTI